MSYKPIIKKAEVSVRGLGFFIEQILKIWDKQT